MPTPEPPSDRQLAYARDLGIKIPPGATKLEVSDLIEFKVSEDTPAAPSLRAFAQRHGIDFTQYAGRARIYGWIWGRFIKDGHELDLASWFAFRVFVFNDADRHPEIVDADNARIREVAAKLVKDPSIMKSIRRYDGLLLMHWGEYRTADGSYSTGSSKGTAAYKAAVAALTDAGLL